MSNFSIGDSPPASSVCQLEILGCVANLTLTRSNVFNALSPELIDDLCEVLDWCKDRSVAMRGSLRDDDGSEFLRVIVLRGEGKHFCAGADIGWMQQSGSQTYAENRADAQRLDRLFNSLWSSPCFTIGVAQGVALGGGAGLVACLDHVIAEPRTKIALSEGKLGILPAVIGPYVYRRLGSAQTRRMAMLAGRIDADEALRIGMVDQLEDSPEDAVAAIQAVIDEVMTTGPVAVHEAKKLVLTFDRFAVEDAHNVWSSELVDQLLRKMMLDKTSEMRGSAEGQEGLSSFIEKRPAAWKSEE